MIEDTRPGRDPEWNLTYTGFDPAAEKLRETLCTVGNGYFGTRGCFEGVAACETHYPGTYIAGVYNKVASTVAGKEIWNTDFVNCPNWLPIMLRIDDEEIHPFRLELLEYEQNLDMREAVMSRRMVVRESNGRMTVMASERIADMAAANIGAIRYAITPVNYSGRITLRSSIDGTVTNSGVPRYRGLNNRHLSVVATGVSDDHGHYLHVETTQSRVQIVMCMRNDLVCSDSSLQAQRSTGSSEGAIAEILTVNARQGTTITLEKVVSIATSRDIHTASPMESARSQLARASGFDAILARHREQWHPLWDNADIRIGGDLFAQQVVRLHIYHLLSTASSHNVHIDAGMPARGLHGEAYRGHIFWDSLYVLPFYFKRFPDIARAALMYRYRRLDAARNYAREHGFGGAMYPWQSAEDGQEETPTLHLNPVSGVWDPDLSCRQRHVSLAIFYNVWEYYDHTGDSEFLNRYGAEMLFEIARFWASIARLDPADGRFHIRGG